MRRLRKYQSFFTSAALVSPLFGISLSNQDTIYLAIVCFILFFVAFKIKSFIIRRILFPSAILLVLWAILNHFAII